MSKSINLILIGVLTIASLLLALPFTPLRNSFSGITSKYMDNAVAKMGVDFSGQIKNARLVTKSRAYQVAGLEANEQRIKKRINSASDYNGLNPNGNAVNYSFNSNTDRNSTTKSASGGGGIASISTSSNKKSNDKTGLKPIEFISTSTDLTTKGKPTTLQAGKTYAENEGGTHPGLDPLDPPPSLPVGDGLNSLLILAAIFAAFKIKNSFYI